jgi:hemerythrin-like domain-containing protein
VIADSAKIVREFIEDYHEKLEEEEVFPRFSGKMDRLVGILLDQHKAGRRVTDVILKLGPTSRKDEAVRQQVAGAMQNFITMYRPHSAREDTVLFPRLKDLVSANEYAAMAEDFEKREHALFGDDGFEAMVHRVAAIEQTIGIWDISQFTAR